MKFSDHIQRKYNRFFKDIRGFWVVAIGRCLSDGKR